MKRITYLLGAGASYYSHPIWKEQGEKMIELAEKYIDEKFKDFENLSPRIHVDKLNRALYEIGVFGKKSLKYGTIDTYAKKLFLNESHPELLRLKYAVSMFFTLWQLTNDNNLKSRNGFNFEEIDRRYLSLMAAITEKNDRQGIKIKDNIKFVTWNYDLQLELAFKAFTHDNSSWDFVDQNLGFRMNSKFERPLQICHLNGYHGSYITDNKEIDFHNYSQSKDIKEILEKLEYMAESVDRRQINFHDTINYAWENSPIASKTREVAKNIFQETDILIIIGYSFPNFNKEIDKTLFEKLKGRNTTIYYQDPNASETLLRQLVNQEETKFICEKSKTDVFILPYEF
jgi:hypothetical protein